MLKEFFTAALGMQAQQTKLEVTANNMANANTAGFKKESVFIRNLIDARANFYNVPGDLEQDDPPVGSYMNFSAGAFRQTDNPLDIAIEGDGFFVLQDFEGKEFYTRSGRFKISEEGTLQAMDGKTLMGNDGPVNIYNEAISEPFIDGDSKSIDIKITENGEVFANDYLVGSVQIADIDNKYSLQHISNAQFIVQDDTIINYLPLEDVKVRQGWMEGSNVNIIDEMVQMIELQRLFEAGDKVVKTNDTTLGESIKIGKYY